MVISSFPKATTIMVAKRPDDHISGVQIIKSIPKGMTSDAHKFEATQTCSILTSITSNMPKSVHPGPLLRLSKALRAFEGENLVARHFLATAENQQYLSIFWPGFDDLATHL